MQLPKLNLHNKYYIELRNSSTGELKQKGYAENTVLRQYFLTSANIYRPTHRSVGFYIYFGNGTAEPQYTDTALTSLVFKCKGGKNGYMYAVDDDTICQVVVYTVPATSNYVGDLTEVGVGHDILYSKALIKDAEGNNITIHKTDLDELTVTLKFYVQRVNTDGFRWHLGEYSPYTRMWYDSYCGITPPLAGYDSLGGGAYSTDYYRCNISTAKPSRYAMTPLVNKYSIRPTLSGNKITIPSQRFTADEGNTHFIHSINFLAGDEGDVISYSMYFPSALFPAYTVTDMSVGTGDGEQTEFEPPIGLWIKDTDKVYIDGVEQVRDVDYTIDNKANRTRMHEITPGSFVSKYTNEKSFSWSSECKKIPFTEMCTAGQAGIMADSALIFELEEDPTVGLDINYWIPGYWYVWNGSVSTGSAAGCVITLSYSTDGATYIEIDSYTYSTDTNSLPRSFEKVNAKYWKVACKNLGSGKVLHQSSSSISSRYISESYLGYYGEPIKFTNPPTAGAVITMDCAIDRPYKNSNFVIDFCPEFQF